jgi:hypothetical protein
MRKRRRFPSITVDVDVGDVLGQLDDEDILEEVAVRELTVTSALGCDKSDAEQALYWLQRGDAAEAALVLERALYPKFRDVGACMALFAKVTGKAAQ